MASRWSPPTSRRFFESDAPWLRWAGSISSQLEVAWRAHQILATLELPYVIIGGIAVQHWGHPRFTRDLDLTVLVQPGQERAVAEALVQRLEPRIPDAVDFAVENRVLLVCLDGCDIDISFGIPGYEEDVIANAQPLMLDRNRHVKVCSVEDLIIHKAISGRPRDREDLEAIVARNLAQLDTARIRLWLREFVAILESEDPLAWFESALNEQPLETEEKRRLRRADKSASEESDENDDQLEVDDQE